VRALRLWLYREHLTALAAYGDLRSLRRLAALDRLERRWRIAEWKSWYAAAEEVGIPAGDVTELVLLDAFGDVYLPPEQRRAAA
jgi:hypothetical protein